MRPAVMCGLKTVALTKKKKKRRRQEAELALTMMDKIRN